jgi:hypothetical protein
MRLAIDKMQNLSWIKTLGNPTKYKGDPTNYLASCADMAASTIGAITR